MNDESVLGYWSSIISSLPADDLRQRRWFRKKSEAVLALRLWDCLDVTGSAPPGPSRLLLALVEAETASGRANRFLLPLEIAPAGSPRNEGDLACVDGAPVREALGSSRFHTAVRRLMDERSDLPGSAGRFAFEKFEVQATRQCRPLAETSTNSLHLVKGDDVVKYIRGLEPGLSPELELGKYFSSRGEFANYPPLTGAARYFSAGGEEYTLAVATRFIENDGDLWRWTQEFLAGLLQTVEKGGSEPEIETVRTASFEYLRLTDRLADVLASMHRALSSGPASVPFASEPVEAADLASWSDGMARGAESVFSKVGRVDPGGDPSLQDFFRRFPRLRRLSLDAFRQLAALDPTGWHKCRVHGDFHLGQALKAGEDFYVIDFEGEPMKASHLRAAKYVPLKDVAGLLRSYNYAAYAALFAHCDRPGAGAGDFARAEPALLGWNEAVESRFFDRYAASSGWPRGPETDRLLQILKLEKAVYELDYEINNRPTWLRIPVQGIVSCLRGIFPSEEV